MRVEVDMVRVKRMSIKRNNTGLVKFKLVSKAMVEKVLKNKTKLRETDNHPEIQSLCVHKLETTERLIEEHNSDVLLQELNLTEKYWCMPSDRLMLNRGSKATIPEGDGAFKTIEMATDEGEYTASQRVIQGRPKTATADRASQ